MSLNLYGIVYKNLLQLLNINILLGQQGVLSETLVHRFIAVLNSEFWT